MSPANDMRLCSHDPATCSLCLVDAMNALDRANGRQPWPPSALVPVEVDIEEEVDIDPPTYEVISVENVDDAAEKFYQRGAFYSGLCLGLIIEMFVITTTVLVFG